MFKVLRVLKTFTHKNMYDMLPKSKHYLIKLLVWGEGRSVFFFFLRNRVKVKKNSPDSEFSISVFGFYLNPEYKSPNFIL